MASLAIFSRFRRTIWAPALHSISPLNTVYPDQTLTQVATLLTQARLAYPHFQLNLKRALTLKQVAPTMKLHLQNLRDVFEFFIPVVSQPRWTGGSKSAHTYALKIPPPFTNVAYYDVMSLSCMNVLHTLYVLHVMYMYCLGTGLWCCSQDAWLVRVFHTYMQDIQGIDMFGE